MIFKLKLFNCIIIYVIYNGVKQNKIFEFCKKKKKMCWFNILKCMLY